MNKLNISLRQLQYFQVVARHKSLRQAANELGIRQPSLTAQLQSLEELLGVTLFDRNRSGIRITPLGRDLLVEARACVSAARNMVEISSASSGKPIGTYRLGVSRSLGPYALPFVLPALHKRYKDVKFFVREDVPAPLVRGLDDGDYDFIFSTMPIDEPTIEVYPLFREPIYLVVNVNHPLADEEELQPTQLKGLEILTIQENYLFNRQIEELSKRFNARLLRDYEGTSLDAIRQMVYLEMGVAFLPALYVRSEIRDREDLRVLKLAGDPVFRQHALAWCKTSTQGKYYRKFAELFQEVAGNAFGNDAILM